MTFLSFNVSFCVYLVIPRDIQSSLLVLNSEIISGGPEDHVGMARDGTMVKIFSANTLLAVISLWPFYCFHF